MIPCSIEKWISLVEKFTTAQRFRFYETGLEEMLIIPSVQMRDFLLHFMMLGYNPNSKKFMIQEDSGSKGLISLRPDDVFSIFGFKNEGEDVFGILATEGKELIKKIPIQYVQKNGHIMIDDLIQKIVRNKSADDEFLRMAVLVLLGTIIAPMSAVSIPKEYYALVHDVKRISTLNFNVFTLRTCLTEIGKLKQDGRVRQWPCGNLALLQVCY